MIRRSDAPFIWIDQFCMNSWAHLQVWCRPGTPCNQHPTEKAEELTLVPLLPPNHFVGHACSTKDTSVVGEVCACLSNSSSHAHSWGLWDRVDWCPPYTDGTRVSYSGTGYCVSPRRLYFSCVLCLTILSQGGHGLQVDTRVGNDFSMAALSWAARLVWDTEQVLCLQWLCSAGAALLLLLPSVAGLVRSVQELLFHLFRFFGWSSWPVRNISFNSTEILLKFCFGTR